MSRFARPLGLAAALALAIALPAAAWQTAMKTPRPVSPAAGATDLGVPALGWSPTSGAERYDVALSADPSFSSPIAQGFTVGLISTQNTWATLTKLPPNGTYWWHVRAVGKTGDVSAWSPPRSFRRAWTTAPVPLSPRSGAIINYPSTVALLSWSPVPYAAQYRVSLATDPALANLWGGRTIETQATSWVPPEALKAGTYYWAVTPVDAEGNTGTRSRVSTFSWTWPTATTLKVTDLVAANEVFDPLFTWRAVPGAVKYDLEINPSQDFAQGSKVCCDQPMIGTIFSPTSVLKNNRYYSRVRAIDADGNVGRWNVGPIFTKTFDNVPPVSGKSIRNLHMRDNLGDGGPKPAGWSTSSPIVVWDPVPGASAYEVETVPFNTVRPNDCNWTAGPLEHWLTITATPAWTPLGSTTLGGGPYQAARTVSKDMPGLKPGTTYCVRVRALSDLDVSRAKVFGDYTYLLPAFQFTGFAAGAGAPTMKASDYLEPQQGKLERRMPLFTWRVVPGAASYFVLVSKDPSFTTVVDYAFTQIPAYAPREPNRAMTYSDETTSYYWAVLPSHLVSGNGAAGNPLLQSPAKFEKRSIPPALVLPRQGTRVSGPATFRWTPVEAARRYRLQISVEKSFGNLIDDVVTDSASYTSTRIYPADVALYWRVRAEDENFVGLTWSATRVFRNLLPAPVPSRKNPTRGDELPTWSWAPVPGALSYDFHIEQPDGHNRDFSNIRASAATPLVLTGTGVFHWKVRAVFAQSTGTAVGPYSPTMSFTRTISAPSGARARVSARGVLLSWKPKPGAKAYEVQISSAPDFGVTVEKVMTSVTSYAPTLRYISGPAKSMRFFWRVAAVDNDRNVGNYTQPQTFQVRTRSSK